MLRKMRGTVSMLWASTSGRAAKTSASCAGSALKSGISNSTPQPGTVSWMATAVGEVIAGHAGDGGVAQAHRGNRLGDPARLVGVERLRLAGGDLAEIAA